MSSFVNSEIIFWTAIKYEKNMHKSFFKEVEGNDQYFDKMVYVISSIVY
jgi:hypothetical protein